MIWYVHRKVAYGYITDVRKISSVFTGLVRLRRKAATKPVSPSFDGSEPATTWNGGV